MQGVQKVQFSGGEIFKSLQETVNHSDLQKFACLKKEPTYLLFQKRGLNGQDD